jgi:lysophospholipase L1-like esterase
MPCRILPLGDSITAGVYSTDNAGYRSRLFHLMVQPAQKLTFVGTAADGPATVDGVPFPRQHEGHPGWVIDQVAALVDSVVPQARPQVVTVMLGTNDINLSRDLPNAPARMGALLDKLVAAAPTALVIVAEVLPTQSGNPNVTKYNAGLRALVNQRISAGKHMVLVDMYSAFTSDPKYGTTLMYDNLHPNDAGYALMATVWYQVIGPMFH